MASLELAMEPRLTAYRKLTPVTAKMESRFFLVPSHLAHCLQGGLLLGIYKGLLEHTLARSSACFI